MIIDVILAIFANHAITSIILYDNIFLPLRKWAGYVYFDDGDFAYIDDSDQTFFKRVLRCRKCTSVWVGIFLGLLFYVNNKLLRGVCLAFISADISNL